MAFTLSSPAFADGEAIPTRYTRDGDNISPPLHWSGTPEGTKSFILIVEDPDAPHGTFRHWALYNIPGDRTSLDEQSGPQGRMGCGRNDFGTARYEGPEPPKGHGVHHYHFRLGALRSSGLSPAPQTSVQDIWKMTAPDLIGETELVGTYKR